MFSLLRLDFPRGLNAFYQKAARLHKSQFLTAPPPPKVLARNEPHARCPGRLDRLHCRRLADVGGQTGAARPPMVQSAWIVRSGVETILHEPARLTLRTSRFRPLRGI